VINAGGWNGQQDQLHQDSRAITVSHVYGRPRLRRVAVDSRRLGLAGTVREVTMPNEQTQPVVPNSPADVPADAQGDGDAAKPTVAPMAAPTAAEMGVDPSLRLEPVHLVLHRSLISDLIAMLWSDLHAEAKRQGMDEEPAIQAAHTLTTNAFHGLTSPVAPCTLYGLFDQSGVLRDYELIGADGAYIPNADVRARSPWRQMAAESRPAQLQRAKEAMRPPVHDDGRAVGNFL
jgi:hypothetical protein